MKKNLKQTLHGKKLKATPTRLKILELFSKNACSPISAENIQTKLKKYRLDLATIYRNLIAFEKFGLIKKIELQQKADYFELAGHHHHHIICKKCGQIEKFSQCNLESLKNNLLRHSKNFDTVTDHSLEFFGLCRQCK